MPALASTSAAVTTATTPSSARAATSCRSSRRGRGRGERERAEEHCRARAGRRQNGRSPSASSRERLLDRRRRRPRSRARASVLRRASRARQLDRVEDARSPMQHTGARRAPSRFRPRAGVRSPRAAMYAHQHDAGDAETTATSPCVAAERRGRTGRDAAVGRPSSVPTRPSGRLGDDRAGRAPSPSTSATHAPHWPCGWQPAWDWSSHGPRNRSSNVSPGASRDSRGSPFSMKRTDIPSLPFAPPSRYFAASISDSGR